MAIVIEKRQLKITVIRELKPGHSFVADSNDLVACVKKVLERPGMTSREVAELALMRDLAGSDSKDPAMSLASTLAKEVREGRHQSIRAERVNGLLRYTL